MSIPIFLDWCSKNGIIIDPRICICHDEERGVHVISKDVPIPPGDTLVFIPKDAVLSAKSCTLSDNIPFELHGLGAQLGLAFALYSESLLSKQSSRWFGYLQLLPSVDLPLFWEFDPPGQRAAEPHILDPGPNDLLLWFRGTEVMKQLYKKDDSNRMVPDSLDHYYHHTVLPILSQPDIRDRSSQEPNLTAFRKAYSLVSSRAFFLDAYHGLAMTPVADASSFNHTLENHVHIESEFYVCPECGSFRECEHDSDDDRHHTRSPSTDVAHELYYEMVSNAEIQSYEEVFNTYGEGLSNAQLMVQYGFILDPNDKDVLNFDADEILSSLSTHVANSDIPLLKDADLISYTELFDHSDLVFSRIHSSSETEFCIDSDGRISFLLWIFVLQQLCWSRDYSKQFRVDDLRAFSATQIVLENIIQDGRSCSAENENDELDPARVAILVEVARVIVRLCETRKSVIGHPNHVGENLGELLDAVPADRRRFRLALSVLMSERSILDSCRSKWFDFASTFGSAG